MKHWLSKNKRGAVLTSLVALSLAVAVIDSSTPFGTTIWILHIGLIVLSVFTAKPSAPLILASFASLLTIVNFYSATALDATYHINLISRTLGLITFWVVALIVLKLIRSGERLVANQLATEETNQLLANEAAVKTALGDINDSMRGIQNVEDLCRSLLERVIKFVDAKIGSFYLVDEDHTSLKRVALYAYSDPVGLTRSFAFNEGLIGEAAAQLKPLELNDISPDYFLKIKSSLGEMCPKHLIALPVFFEGKLNGVMELGTVQPFTEVSRKILEIIPENIGIAVDLASSRAQLQVLLREAERYNDELQTQQEELQTLNEELSEKSKEIEVAYRKLEKQQVHLEEANSELEQNQQALERQKHTLQETNVILKNAKREVEAASQYKSEFLSTMSHELRTPLNSILILSQLLAQNKQGVLSAEDVESLKTISSSGKDLLNLINDILDLARIEAGKVELNPESIELSSLLRHFEATFMPQAANKGLSFEVICHQSVEIYTDRQRLEQIIKNFLSNAIKFTQEGKVVLSGHKTANDAFPLSITVEDSGIGIDREKQESIFEAFRQADGTTARQYGGTGLGLSISRELATLIGGVIELESTKGQGSKFSLMLAKEICEGRKPLAKEQATASAEDVGRFDSTNKVNLESSEPSVERVRSSAFKDDREIIQKNDKVLQIIEDEPKFAQIVAKLARKQNFKCLLSEDGETGLIDAHRYLPQGIFLDVKLPGMSGMEVLEKLKNNPKTRHIPVHVASGYDSKKNALHLGALSFLRKPVDATELEIALLRIEDIGSRNLKKILVVEDNEAQLSSMLRLISDLKGVETVGVKSGGEAFHQLSSVTFDCIILDLSLPDMNGIELLEKMATDENLTNPPVIIYTAKDLSTEEENRLRQYSDSIIIKSVHSPERLLNDTMLFLHKVEDQLPDPKQQVLKAIREQDQLLQGAKILLVDDDMRNVFSLRRVLEDKAAIVTIARNGQEALDCLEERPDFDIVLMDIMMPIMDGYEAMARIRKQAKFNSLPVIALTAKAMKGDREKCIEAGANDYLPKPVEIERLLSLVRVWLSPRGF